MLERAAENVMSEFGNAMKLYFGGDMEASIALCGQVAGRVEAIEPVEKVIRQTTEEFFRVVADLGSKYAQAEGARSLTQDGTRGA